MSLVLDASTTLAWCFRDEETEGSRAIFQRVRQDGETVPALWLYEVANAVLVGVRRKRLRAEDGVRFLDALGSLQLSVDTHFLHGGVLDVFDVAQRHNLSVYDASYVELAREKMLPLATKDSVLRALARKLNVSIVEM